MTHDPEPPDGGNPPGPAPTPMGGDPHGIDRVIRWCVVIFTASVVILGAIAWYAIRTDRVGSYLTLAGVIYLGLSTAFLAVLAVVFVQGHLGSSREIEAPKIELFDLEKRQ